MLGLTAGVGVGLPQPGETVRWSRAKTLGEEAFPLVTRSGARVRGIRCSGRVLQQRGKLLRRLSADPPTRDFWCAGEFWQIVSDAERASACFRRGKPSAAIFPVGLVTAQRRSGLVSLQRIVVAPLYEILFLEGRPPSRSHTWVAVACQLAPGSKLTNMTSQKHEHVIGELW